MSAPVKILIAPRRTGGNRGRQKTDGWSFPPAVARLIEKECAGMSILHLFGGKAKFGTRMDIDRLTRPDVIADAWLPPFAENSFDCVVLNPVYEHINQQNRMALTISAASIARRRVVWFCTLWIDHAPGLRMEAGYLCRPSDGSLIRCLQFFRKTRPVKPLKGGFTRGPAIKYNRWLMQPEGLPFPENRESAVGSRE